jgi:FMN phosphatase YigB (HAD superfamily)
VLGTIIDDYFQFDFYIFSDLIGVPKPSPDFFNRVWIYANVQQLQQLSPNRILHIGDSVGCDGGAEAVGMNFHHTVTSSDIWQAIRNLA